MLGSNKYLLVSLIVSMIFTAEFTLAQSEYRFEHYSKKDGLGNDFTHSLAQDSLGYIWTRYFANLTSYDGYNFKVYRYDSRDSLRSNLNFHLGTLINDDDNNIWIGQHKPHRRDKILKYDRKTDGFIKYEIDLKGAGIASIQFDKHGSFAWIGSYEKALFGYDFRTGELTNYFRVGADGKPTRPFTIMSVHDLGSSLLLASGYGLWIFDKNSKSFRRPPCSPADSTTLFAPQIIAHFDKHDHDAWLLGGRSLVKIDSNFSVVHRFDIPPGVFIEPHKLTVDNDGVLWFGGAFESKTGLYRYDPRDSSFINLKHDPSNPNSLGSDIIYDVMIDSDQNVWVGTDHGISVLRKRSLTFRNQSIQEGTLYASGLYKSNGSEYLVINKLFADNGPNVNQILMGHLRPGQLDIKLQPVLKPIVKGFVQHFYQGHEYFWISRWPVGLTGYPIDRKTGMFNDSNPREIFADENDPNKISGGGGMENSKGDLMVSSLKGIDIVSLNMDYGSTGSVRHIPATKPNAEFLFSRDGKSYWTMNFIGNHIGIFHEQADTIENVIELNEMVTTLKNSSNGSLLIGTQNALFEAVQENGRYELKSEPLISNVDVNAIQEDLLGRVWVYGDDRIICYDRSTKVTTVFGEEDGLEHCRTMYTDWLHLTKEGIMIAADPNGLSFFDPSTFKLSQRKVSPVLISLAINNRVVRGKILDGDENFILPADISVLKELVLDYKHNNFSVGFSAMEMTAPAKNLYQHKLEGYDPDWIMTDYKNRMVTYTNLPPGEYTFRVKASNHHSVWSDQERKLKVTILPPPWRTSWAYTGYGLLVIGLLFLGRKNIVQRERLKSNLKLAKVEQEKEHFELEKAIEVDKVKSTFFANISHEFRTPLTLIKGPVQNLLEQFADHPNVKEQLKLVQRNSDLLLKLINQLLDLAKLESGNLVVEKSENDLNSFLTAVINSFSSLAFQKSIALEMELPAIRNLVRFDKDKVETILINLINNAIKFTPSGGSVTVRTEVKGLQAHAEPQSSGTPLGAGGMTITVSDTGIGIPMDQQSKVFERFHQVSAAHKEVGTGIGLSLVKELVALMEGSLILKSEPGSGSTFTVTLPIEVIRVLSETEEVVDSKEQLVSEGFALKDNGNGHEPHDDNRPRILVVEDNGDLRRFIIDCLGKEFCFLEAADGKQGMETAFQETPDLIISDVMMPEMDGITMTGKLKKDTRTSHIPLLLLTAKTSDESKLSGLGIGADDYLTKPFNKNELLLKARNSIATRVKLREKIKLELLKDTPKVEVQSEEEQFLYKIREIILNRLSDEQLSVESLAEEVNLSRSQLLRKITALTGVSVNELIRTFRLQKAAQLLEQNWGPVTQIAYEVGFSNLSYFSKVFKEQYGMLPSEYATKV